MNPINPYLFTIASIIWLGAGALLITVIHWSAPSIVMVGIWGVVWVGIDNLVGWKK